MIADNTLIKVRNRANGSVGYRLENNFHRKFEPNEVKQIPFKELKELQYAPGGDYALSNLLVVEDEAALRYLNMKVEPEYFYDENKIKELLLTGSIDAFADFLDFAPDGAIDLAKSIAVREEIPDVRKRDMLSEKTGLNINNAIMVNKAMEDGEDSKKEDAPKQRRVAIEETKTEAPQRRTATPPKYNVVSK